MRMENCRSGSPRIGSLVVGLVLAGTLLLPAGVSSLAAQAPAPVGKQAVITVEGLQCPFCAYGIQKQLKKLPGATKVEVELAENQAIVSFKPGADVSDDQLREAVRKAGFTADTIEWRSCADPKARPCSQG